MVDRYYFEPKQNRFVKSHYPIKKHIFWIVIVFIVGIFSTFFAFKLIAFSYNHIVILDNDNLSSYFIEDKELTEDKKEKKYDISVEESENIFLDENIQNKNKEKKDNEVLDFKTNISMIAPEGLLMFRGNLSRTFYGFGPIPKNPITNWKYPKEPMCASSTTKEETKIWCGTGWTGQPVVWEREDGITEIIFGAYDKKVHFVDSGTGKDLRDPFLTGDIIKGSVTLDPDGFPLLYFGSRDNKLRILGLDGDVPKELWSLDSTNMPGIWNDDWDGNPLIYKDILFEGGENGWFYAIKLNREIDENQKVKVNPKIIFSLPSYNKDLINLVGENLSIENSVVFFDDRIYFANSGGRILGIDISKIDKGIGSVVFDYWVGDDTDATIVVDEEGMLYVSVELERFNERSKKLGQFIKLNPYIKDDPYVWGIQIPKENLSVGGIWATPALYSDYLYISTHTGKLLTIDKNNGEILWEDKIGQHAWSSPVIVDNEMLVGTCSGFLKKYSLNDPRNPTLTWSYKLGNGSCIESTPAVWKNQIFVGTRDGYFYKIGNE